MPLRCGARRCHGPAGLVSGHPWRGRHALPGGRVPGAGRRRRAVVAQVRKRQSYRQPQGPHGGPAGVARAPGRRHTRGGGLQRQCRRIAGGLLCRRRAAGRHCHHPQLPAPATGGHAALRRPPHGLRRQPGALAARGGPVPQPRRLRRHQLPESAGGHASVRGRGLQTHCPGNPRCLRPAHRYRGADRARRPAVGHPAGLAAPAARRPHPAAAAAARGRALCPPVAGAQHRRRARPVGRRDRPVLDRRRHRHAAIAGSAEALGRLAGRSLRRRRRPGAAAVGTHGGGHRTVVGGGAGGGHALAARRPTGRRNRRWC